MATFKFKRTVQYTEEVTVEAETLAEARELAEEAEGERNHDDTVIDITECK